MAAYATTAIAVAAIALRMTTNQGGIRQNTSRRKASTASPNTAGAKIALIQTGL
jgi:hypothetical protein